MEAATALPNTGGIVTPLVFGMVHSPGSGARWEPVIPRLLQPIIDFIRPREVSRHPHFLLAAK